MFLLQTFPMPSRVCNSFCFQCLKLPWTPMDPEDVRCSSYPRYVCPMCGIITSWNAPETWDVFELIVLLKRGTWWYPRWRIPQFNLPLQTSDSWLVDIGWLFFSFMHSLWHRQWCQVLAHFAPTPSFPSFPIAPPHCSTLMPHFKDIPKLGHDLPGNSTTQRGKDVSSRLVDSCQSLQPVLVASWSKDVLGASQKKHRG